MFNKNGCVALSMVNKFAMQIVIQTIVLDSDSNGCNFWGPKTGLIYLRSEAIRTGIRNMRVATGGSWVVSVQSFICQDKIIHCNILDMCHNGFL